MSGTREIRRRIRSVSNIAKLTKAMETVAAAKMRKAQQQALATRPYAEKSWEVLTHLARLRRAGGFEQPLLQQRPVARVSMLLITGDRGLAGAYNSAVIQAAASAMARHEKQGLQVSLVVVGRQGRDWMLRRGALLRAEFTGLGDRPDSVDAGPVANVLIEDFNWGEFDLVQMAYTKFVTTVRQEPEVVQLLPIVPAEPEPALAIDYIFEPDPQAILGEILRSLTELQILQAMYESIASEQSARRVAMRNASEAADDLIGQLTLVYNKARQESITRELLDIVGGASAQARAGS